MNIDSEGLIVQADLDGGDTIQQSAFFALGESVSCPSPVKAVRYAPCVRAIEKCYAGHGLWVRHPKAGVFWSDPKLTTRDQLVLVFPLLRLHRDWSKLAATTLRLLLRLGFAQNTRSTDGTKRFPDCMIPQMGTVIRSWHPFSLPLYPLLLVFDLLLLIGIAFDLIPYRWKDEKPGFVKRTADDADDDNCIGQLATAILWFPTPVSWLARKVHARFRPWNLGCADPMTGVTVNLMNLHAFRPVYGALRWKHRKETNGNPDVAVAWKRAIDWFWGGA